MKRGCVVVLPLRAVLDLSATSHLSREVTACSTCEATYHFLSPNTALQLLRDLKASSIPLGLRSPIKHPSSLLLPAFEIRPIWPTTTHNPPRTNLTTHNPISNSTPRPTHKALSPVTAPPHKHNTPRQATGKLRLHTRPADMGKAAMGLAVEVGALELVEEESELRLSEPRAEGWGSKEG